MIEIIELTKRYEDFLAVSHLNLKVEKGEIFGFIGPNGAGKTTTIRILSTLLKPTMGKASVNGYDVTRQLDDVRRSIGYMPDSFGVYNGMKVWEFLDFFAVAYGVKRSFRERLINDVLALVDLHHKKNDFVNALSRGMKQRLCLAKTLVHDPPLLILDEPASGLDPRARLEMRELLKELRSMGKTIFISSHILSELAELCDSVGIMERGTLLACGTVKSILAEISSHRIISLQVLVNPKEAERWIGHHPAVKGVESRKDSIVFEFDGSDEELADLYEEITAKKHRPYCFDENRPSLEAVFMKTTKGLVQ
jgi:ABC-2 type transport system ATP-binding protein